MGEDKSITITTERKKKIFFTFCLHLFVLLCHRGQAKPNETVLIHGASGGVS